MTERLYFSLSQAAKETGRSKSTIHKALQNGDLSYVSHDKGQYRIDPAELFRVFSRNVREPSKSNDSEQSRTPGERAEVTALQIKLDAAERLLQEREETIDDLRRRLDKADEERAALTRILTDQRQQQAEKSAKGGFWSRLIRSS